MRLMRLERLQMWLLKGGSLLSLVLGRIASKLGLLRRGLKALLLALTWKPRYLWLYRASTESGRLRRKRGSLLLLLLGDGLEIGERLLLAQWAGPRTGTVRTSEERV